jgi:hypothetical protein
MLTKNIITLFAASMIGFSGYSNAEPDSDVFLNGNVDSVYTISVPQTDVQLPNTANTVNYKIADFFLNSNLPQVTLRYDCASSPNNNETCDLIKSDSNSIEDRIRYYITFDQSQFTGVTSHSGEILINYSISGGKLAGNYSDIITIIIDPNQ